MGNLFLQEELQAAHGGLGQRSGEAGYSWLECLSDTLPYDKMISGGNFVILHQ